jgi:hypothetical protein
MDRDYFLRIFDINWSNTGKNSDVLFASVCGACPDAFARLAEAVPLGLSGTDYLIAYNLIRHAPTKAVHANNWRISAGKAHDIVWSTLSKLSRAGVVRICAFQMHFRNEKK